MVRKTLTSKDLHLACKKGKTSFELMQEFGYQSKEELYTSIRTVAPQGANAFIRSLEKNEKRASKKNHSDHHDDIESDLPEKESEEVVQPEGSELAEDTPEEDMLTHTQKLNELKKLREEEEELSGLLIEVETKHQQKQVEREECIRVLTNSKRTLEELQKLVKVQQGLVTQTVDRYKELRLEMDSLNEDSRVYRELLNGIRDKISETSKVFICFFSDGTIEVDEPVGKPTFSEDEFNTLFTKLIMRPDAGEWTIKALKGIAILYLMVQAYEKENVKYEVIFDNEELCKFYEAI